MRVWVCVCVCVHVCVYPSRSRPISFRPDEDGLGTLEMECGNVYVCKGGGGGGKSGRGWETKPGATLSPPMHELPRNQPAVRRKWIKFIQFKRADFLAAPHHAHLCSGHFTSVSAISQTPWNTAWGLL